MDILSLPPEVLEAVFSRLTPKDVVSISKTCRLFHEISKSDQLWTEVCFNEFGVNIPSAQGFAKRFYKNILHQYRYFLGLWKIHADCYGGILQILYCDGQLCGVELRLPKEPHLTSPLRPKTVFTVSLDANDSPLIKCCINLQQQHSCSLNYGMKALAPNESPSFYLTRQCAEGTDSAEHQEIPDLNRELQRWISDQVDMTDVGAVFRTRSQFIYKYLVLRQMDLKTHYSRLTLPDRCDFNVPIQPGLFKGTYSAHGLEMVLLTYEDNNKVSAVKVTGDPNVPAGKVTFRADLPYCMHLNEESQSTLERIQQIEAVSSEVDWSELPMPQPFVIPEDCEGRYPDVPKYCRARFHGFGQVAREGFQSPSFIEGHWIVFNEDLFAFLWIKLESLSLYHRVQERLT